MARNLDSMDLDKLAELLHDHIDGVREGDITGDDWDLEDLMELHNTLIAMRDGHGGHVVFTDWVTKPM